MSLRRVSLTAALVCAAAVGCARNPERVGVGIGTAAYVDDDARPFAQLYLPYVQMASLAYADPQFLAAPGRRRFVRSDTLLRSPSLVDATHSAADNLAAARRLAALHALLGNACSAASVRSIVRAP